MHRQCDLRDCETLIAAYWREGERKMDAKYLAEIKEVDRKLDWSDE